MRADKKRNVRNQSIMSDLKTRMKKFNALTSSKKKSKDLDSLLKTLTSKIDKAAAKGLIHKNKASRLISRLNSRVKRSRSA